MKTYFEQLSELSEKGMEIEQTIRLVNAQKAWLDNIKPITSVYTRKLAILNRAEKMCKSALLRHKQEVINFINK